MAAKWQRIRVEIPKEFGPSDRDAIGLMAEERIRERTLAGKDKDGNKFKPYTKEYMQSIDFKNAGKSSKVNLRLSGDMLAAMDTLSHKSGSLLIGFENGTDENARADGNIRGTYGQKTSTGKKRDFLGLSKEEVDQIINKYTIENKEISLGAARYAAKLVKKAKPTKKEIMQEQNEE